MFIFFKLIYQEIKNKFTQKKKKRAYMSVHSHVGKLIHSTALFNSLIGLFVGHNLPWFKFMAGHLLANGLEQATLHFFKVYFILIQERWESREKETLMQKKNTDWLPPTHAPQLRIESITPACALTELNWQPFSYSQGKPPSFSQACFITSKLGLQ